MSLPNPRVFPACNENVSKMWEKWTTVEAQQDWEDSEYLSLSVR